MVSPIITMLNTEKHSGVSGIATQLLVLHSGECPLRGGYAQSLTNWGNTPLSQGGPEASWHWFVDPIAIVSMVPAQYAAWHASEANPMSEGFEQAGYARFSRSEWTTPEGMKQLDNLAWLMAQRCVANNIPPVWLTTDQIEAVTKRGNRSIRGLCTHRQIDPETRTDPGDGYPYDQLLAQIRYYMGFTLSPQGTITPLKDKDTGMLYVADQGDGKLWLVSAPFKWHIPDPATAKHIENLAPVIGIWNDGKPIKTVAIGIDVATFTSAAVIAEQFPYVNPVTGKADTMTNIGSQLGSNNQQHVATQNLVKGLKK
jgi:N-acetylmuramoyl-L-alanine amidase